MTRPMSPTEWDILDELERDVLKWGAAVGATWKNLVKHGYVEPNFGDITPAGRQAAIEKRHVHAPCISQRGP